MTVPEMLAKHHLPKVFNSSGIFSNNEGNQILNRSNH